MPNISRFRFECGQSIYDLEINWDEAAFANGIVAVKVLARRTERDGDRVATEGREIAATLKVIPRERSGKVVLRVGSEKEIEVDLSELFDESQILDRIPAAIFTGEPVTGCLIRSGLSSVVGQLITCKSETAGVPWVRDRLIAISRCMRSNIPSMTGRAALRAALCVGRGGS